MNKDLQNFARMEIKEGLAQLPENWQTMFKRMYFPDDINLPIDEVVDLVPEEKLDWAMQQISRSLEKIKVI